MVEAEVKAEVKVKVKVEAKLSASLHSPGNPLNQSSSQMKIDSHLRS